MEWRELRRRCRSGEDRSERHEDTLLEQTAYPLFNYAYFARNTKRPIVNCEDIVKKSQVPGSNLEAMADGDFAQLHKRPWKFLVYGKGVAQSGMLWLNGKKVGEMPRGSWDKAYSFDVGALLNYGGENEIVWRVDGKGGWQNGLRFCCHVLCEDMLNEAKVYAEKEYAAQFGPT